MSQKKGRYAPIHLVSRSLVRLAHLLV